MLPRLGLRPGVGQKNTSRPPSSDGRRTPAPDPQDAPRHAGQVVRRVLLRRNITIDAETAQHVAAVQAALQAGAPAPAAPPGLSCSPGRLRAIVLRGIGCRLRLGWRHVR